MSIGWAIVIVAVLFLLDRYGVLGRSIKTVAAVGLAAVLIGAAVIGTKYAKTVSSDREFAVSHDCYDPLTGHTHKVSAAGSSWTGTSWCEEKEMVHQRGAPPPDLQPCEEHSTQEYSDLPPGAKVVHSPPMWENDHWCSPIKGD
jgi:hypothetical protein